MKKLIIGAAIVAVTSASALAADLPMQAYKSAPVVSQVYNWTGMYVGVNGGYGWARRIRSRSFPTGSTVRALLSVAVCSAGQLVPKSSRDMS
jgi:opacity protein-like surface antigen